MKQIILSSEKSKARGFTLIEMLVVISIIAVMVALLLPALHNARDLGVRMQCLSRVRQLGMATFNYAADSEDVPPFRPVADSTEAAILDVISGGWTPHNARTFYKASTGRSYFIDHYIVLERAIALSCPSTLFDVLNPAINNNYVRNFMSYQYYPGSDANRWFSTDPPPGREQPDYTTINAARKQVPLWGCLSASLSGAATLLAHNRPNVYEGGFQGMNNVFNDGSGRWTSENAMEPFFFKGSNTFYWPIPGL